MKPYLAWILLVSLTLLLTACPAVETGPVDPEPTDPDPIESVTQLGVVMLGDFTAPNYPASTSALAYFNSVAETDAPENPYEAFLDTCFVTQDPNVNPPFLGSPIQVGPRTGLDAGESVTVFAGGEPYVTLRREAGETPYYLEDDLPPGALSEAELSVSIPGGAFPAFERARFVSAPPVTLTAPADPTGLSPESTFAWTPFTPADGHSAVYFSALQLDINDPEAFTAVACFAADDGDFTFPEMTRTELQNAGFTDGSLLEFSRLTTRLELSGDAALYLQTFRQTGYFLGFLSRPSSLHH